MPTLHALLVGINAYPNPRHVLRGCVNDVRHLHQYLENYCGSLGYTYRPLILTDAAATRQAVIDAFDHFQAAGADDCCLFHFSGHGARGPAPEAFWHLEADHQLESIVCWDSRQPGGHDLMDKELSYLIWRAAQGKDLPFVTVMDCCHSGDMRSTREIEYDLQLEVTGIRTLRDKDLLGHGLAAEQWLGIEHYKKSAGGQLSPPLGRRVHLAAARNVEYAKEVIAGGQPRGVFTYCLIEALNATGPLISYANLLNRVNLRINNAVKEQSAQLGATFTEDRNRGFLFSRIDEGRPAYLIAWDKALNAWMLNAGALHGIPAGRGTVLELADGRHVLVEEVLPGRAKVSGMDDLDTRFPYTATLRQRALPKLELAFAPGNDPDGEALLRQCSERQFSGSFQFGDAAEKHEFRVHARHAAYFLSRTHDDVPLFQRENGYTDASAGAFLKKLDTVANWQQVLELHNPDTELRDSEISLELYQLTEARKNSDMDDDAPMEFVDWQAGPIVYRYFNNGATPLLPAFQLRIRNTGHRPLWVGLLYLGADFSITNTLMLKEALAPGETAWALDRNSGYPFRTIPLRIDDDGRTAVDEYLKVLISTEELNTELYNQDGLHPDRGEKGTRGLQLRARPKEQDWTTKTVWLRIEREKPD